MRLAERPGRRATVIVGLSYPLAERLLDEARRRDLPMGEVVEALLAELWPPLRVVDAGAMNERGDVPRSLDAASTTACTVDAQPTG